MTKRTPTKNWRNILWREWRYTDDEEYAEKLLEVLTHKLPFHWKAAFFMMVWGMMWGVIIGLLIVGLNFIFETFAPQPIFREITQPKVISGMGLLGSAFGILMTPLLNKYFRWAGLFFGLGIGTTVGLLTFFLGYSIPDAIFVFILASILGFLFAFYSRKETPKKSLVEVKISEFSRKHLNQRQTLLEYLLPHKRRRWYFWWKDRPMMIEVESALHHARKAHPKIGLDWTQSLRRLEYSCEYPASLDEFVTDLESLRWWERFVARHRLFDYGGEAVTPILSLIHEESEFQAEGVHIIQNIAAETTERLITQSSDLFCPKCLTRCHHHKADIPWQPDITYYGCRSCHQSREFLECPQGIVAVLDANWNKSHRLKNGLLSINWLEQKRMFDFDRVEIIQATDEDVERFAMQSGNDTDPVRQPHYADMPCRIAPDCQLSENSLRILQNFFGKVERQEGANFSDALIEKDELTHQKNVADEESNAHLLSAD